MHILTLFLPLFLIPTFLFAQFNPHFSLVQGAKEKDLTADIQHIRLRPTDFSLEFNGEQYLSEQRTRVVLCWSDSLLRAIEIGDTASHHLHLNPATAMAGDSAYYYFSLAFAEAFNGHHSLHYDGGASSNVKRVGQDGKRYRLSFPISQLYLHGRTILLKSSPIRDLYFVLFSDTNFNDRIDAGELARLHIRLKGRPEVKSTR